MTSPALRNVCFLLGFVTHYAVVFVHTLPYWKVSNWQVSVTFKELGTCPLNLDESNERDTSRNRLY